MVSVATKAAEIDIEDFQADHLATSITVRFRSTILDNYYVLLRGDSVATIEVPVDISLATPVLGKGTLTDRTSSSSRAQGFYRVAAWPRSQPADSDHDGIDDLYELEHAGVLNPLEPRDGALDVDADGRSNLWEYRQNTQPGQRDWGISTAIATGVYQDYSAPTWVLKRDGTLWTLFPPTQVAPGVKFRTTAAGAAVANDGSLWAWGNLWSDNYKPSVPTPNGQVGSELNWTTVTRSRDHALALKKDGSLWAWGYNPDGRLGTPAGEYGDYKDLAEPTRVGTDTDWVMVSAGDGRSLGLKSDGTLWWWGAWNPLRTIPRKVGSDHDWIAISKADAPVLAIKRDGTLWAWGGQLTDPPEANLMTLPPTRVGSDSNWVAPGSIFHSVVLRTDGTAWTVGFDGLSIMPLKTGDESIAACETGSIAPDGTLWAWNNSAPGWVPDGIAVSRVNQPTRVGTRHDWKTGDYTVALQEDGSAWVWGHNYVFSWQQDPQTGTNAPVQVPHQATGWSGVVMGSFHALGLGSNGTLWSWGLNSDGQLGYHGPSPRWDPTQVGSSKEWSKIAAGRAHSLALRRDGTLWAWGLNSDGQAGSPTSSRVVLPPAQVGADQDWTDISAGRDQSLALKSDGSLWGWGKNDLRQLGFDQPSFVETPTRIGTGNDWSAIAAGFGFSLAIKKDGALWLFGFNQVPRVVGADRDWRTASAGVVVALTKRNGTAWIVREWQDRFPYSFGDLATTLVQADNATNWVSLSAGKEHSFTGIKSDGTLWAWGENMFGGAAQPVGYLPLPVVGESGFGWPQRLQP